MTPYFGDFAEDATVYIPFNTFDSNDPSASVTITNLADADIKVHKDAGTTEIATDGATVAIDYDGITGNHMITIDTSAHADYSTGSDYQVRIEGTTVDAGTVNAFIGSFSIENRFNEVSVTSWNGVALSTTNPLPNAAADGPLGLPISDAGGLDLDSKLANTNEVTAARMGALTDWIDNGRLDLILDSRMAEASINTTGGAVDDVTLVATTTTNSDMRGTDGANTTTPPTAAAIVNEWETQSQADPTGFHVNVLEVNGTAQTAGDLKTLIDAIQTEVEKLTSTAHSEPSGVPAANEAPIDKLGYLFMALRNQVDVTATKKTFYDDGGTGEWEKDLSDNGTTYSETEANAI